YVKVGLASGSGWLAGLASGPSAMWPAAGAVPCEAPGSSTEAEGRRSLEKGTGLWPPKGLTTSRELAGAGASERGDATGVRTTVSRGACGPAGQPASQP